MAAVKKRRFDREFLKEAAVYIITAALSVLLVVLILLAAVGTFDDSVETMTAVVSEERAMVAFDAYVMRSEAPVCTSVPGGVNYAVSDGDIIAVGDRIADVYVGGSAAQREQTIKLERKIQLLENSNVPAGQRAGDTSELDGEINSLYSDIYYHVQNGSIGYAIRRRESLLIDLNRREIILRKRFDYSSEIAALERMKNQVASQQTVITGFQDEGEGDGSVLSPYAGYFYAELDGYENIFSADKVSTLTIGEFDRMTASDPEDMSYIAGQGYTIGKIMTRYLWYIACRADRSILMSFRDGYRYTAVFPYSNDVEVPVRLNRIITETDSDEVVLVFSGGELPDDFNFLRRQTVNIVRTSFTGYRVPVSAVRIVNGEQGVYILDGDIVKFRRIDALAQINGYVVCAEQNPQSDPDYALKLGLYDQVITKGKNLYDGKIIN